MEGKIVDYVIEVITRGKQEILIDVMKEALGREPLPGDKNQFELINSGLGHKGQDEWVRYNGKIIGCIKVRYNYNFPSFSDCPSDYLSKVSITFHPGENRYWDTMIDEQRKEQQEAIEKINREQDGLWNDVTDIIFQNSDDDFDVCEYITIKLKEAGYKLSK